MPGASPNRTSTDLTLPQAFRQLGLIGAMTVSVLAEGGCATQTPDGTDSAERVSPVPVELRERSDEVVLRVTADSELELDLGYTLTEASSEERTADGSGAALQGGAAVALVGCHPQWSLLWVFTCPGGAVVGAGVALVGSAGAAIYGGTTAWSREEIDAAQAVMDHSRQQTNLANELRERLIHTLHETGSTTLVHKEPEAIALREPTPDRASPVVLAIDIEHFVVSEIGDVSPDLWIDFEVSGGLYEFPANRPAYERKWRLEAELGNFYDLVSAGGLGLRNKLDAAFDEMALTIADDLFGTVKTAASNDEDDFNGEVVTVYAMTHSSTDTELSKQPTMLSSYIVYRTERGVVDTAGPTESEMSDPLKKVSLSVGILPTAFLSGTLPSTTTHEASLNAALKEFIFKKPTLNLTYDYSARDATALENYNKLWVGSAIKKEPSELQLQRAARQLDLDIIVMAWVENAWATTIIDLYVYDPATGSLYRTTGSLGRAEALAASAYSLRKSDQRVTCNADFTCQRE